MKYYVVSDIHGYFSKTKSALEDAGFFRETEPHKLIVCGDMFDRGKEAQKMQEFMMNLLEQDKLVFIRGNHEDLLVDLISNFRDYEDDIAAAHSFHIRNGTWDTALQLTGMKRQHALSRPDIFIKRVKQTDAFSKLLPASKNFFETQKHIFVHGWIPCITEDAPAWYQRNRTYQFNPEWRNAGAGEWQKARWFNGMALAHFHNIKEAKKTIVCGHWHASYGHSYIEGKCQEFGKDSDFSPFYSNGVIGIDACTAYSGKVNCIVIEDEELQ